MRTPPARKGIRAEARVNHGNGRLKQRIGQIRIERSELPRRQHTFIYDRLVRQAGDVEILPEGILSTAQRVFRAATDEVQFALERQVILDGLATANENLPDKRLAGLCRLSKINVIRGHLTPSEEPLPLAGDNFFEGLFTPLALISIGRQENHADAILSGFRQTNSQTLTCVLKKSVRDLEQDTSPIARILLAATRAAVIQIFQDGQRLLDDLAGFIALDIDHEADAARVVLEFGIIKSLFRREPGFFHLHILRQCGTKEVPSDFQSTGNLRQITSKYREFYLTSILNL